jgi:ArsR family transcriptional regulator, arsenate/arsenite/antimonite-responsive transcriptional repressor
MNALFKALDDPTRRRIIEMLRQRDMTAGEIADAFSITKPSISHHLDLLKQANIVLAIKKGQFITYSLNTSVLDDLIKWILDITQSKNQTT